MRWVCDLRQPVLDLNCEDLTSINMVKLSPILATVTTGLCISAITTTAQVKPKNDCIRHLQNSNILW
jgi:hypothetical protein